MLASVHDSSGSRSPPLGSCVALMAGYGFQTLRLISSSSFMGRDTDMSRMLMPHGLPTYILHMLVRNQHPGTTATLLFILVVDEDTPEGGPSNIEVPLTQHSVAVFFYYIKVKPEIGTEAHSHTYPCHQFLCLFERSSINLPLYSQPRASRVKAASVALMMTSAWTVATLGLSISTSSKAFALAEKNSGPGIWPALCSPVARLAPIAQLDLLVQDVNGDRELILA